MFSQSQRLNKVRLEKAMKFIRQLCGDEYSLHEYGATRFLDSFNTVYGREGIERAFGIVPHLERQRENWNQEQQAKNNNQTLTNQYSNLPFWLWIPKEEHKVKSSKSG
jgi:hypothetical protein